MGDMAKRSAAVQSQPILTPAPDLIGLGLTTHDKGIRHPAANTLPG